MNVEEPLKKLKEILWKLTQSKKIFSEVIYR